MAVNRPEVEEIWLFGSLARGDAVPGSDADLLLVLSSSDLPFLERYAFYIPNDCGVGVDVLAYTRHELALMRAEGNFFAEQALLEGICLFRRK